MSVQGWEDWVAGPGTELGGFPSARDFQAVATCLPADLSVMCGQVVSNAGCVCV